jgi:alpha-tubulin suppressor-like RCC1 family protein
MAPLPSGYTFPLPGSSGAQYNTTGWLYGWGSNTVGSLGINNTTNYSAPVQVGALTNWWQVAFKGVSSVTTNVGVNAIKYDGTLWAWGYDNSGGLGLNAPTVYYSSPVQVGTLTNWSQVSNGPWALKTDGTLWVLGGGGGSLGLNNVTVSYSSPVQVGALTTWKQVSCGYGASAGIKTDGTLWTCGYNGTGTLVWGTMGGGLGLNVITNYSSPTQVGALTNWKQVSFSQTGSTCMAVKTDGTLWGWGIGNVGNLGLNVLTNYSSPVQVGALTNWSQVAHGRFHFAAIKTDGTLWTCGYNLTGALGNNAVVNYSSPVQVGALTSWKYVYAGLDNNAAIKTDGTLWVWGSNTYGQLGLNVATTVPYSSPVQVGTLTSWASVGIGPRDVMGIIGTPNNVDMADMFVPKDLFLNGGLFGMGRNSIGSLGNGTATAYSSPVQVGTLTNWKQISPTSNSTIGIKVDGSLWAWGYNRDGQLGNSTTTNYSSPIAVGALTNWKFVSCGYSSGYSVLAIKTDGTLWAWGNNRYGQLGNGTGTYYSSPIQIGALTNWKQISLGFSSAAIKTDNTLWTWGDNTYGQLGISAGSTTHYSSPIQVGALTNWKQVSSGSGAFSRGFIAAIKTDGTLWAWGQNSSTGALGNNTLTNYSSPIQIGALTNWNQVSTGDKHISAIKTDGTLWACGYNLNGQLGNGTVTSYSSPIQIGALTNWKSVACGGSHTMAIKTDGTLWGWGGASSNFGQLGNNTVVNYSSPIQIGTLTNWKQVYLNSSCSDITLAIQAPELP